MIPIAGSAYTYTYACMGELIAWIIGWDLILEYAVSNMAVGVGFSAHVVDLFDFFGLHLSARWSNPAFLPTGGGGYDPGWHFGFNWPAFIIVMLLTVILVRGIRESDNRNIDEHVDDYRACLVRLLDSLQPEPALRRAAARLR